MKIRHCLWLFCCFTLFATEGFAQSPSPNALRTAARGKFQVLRVLKEIGVGNIGGGHGNATYYAIDARGSGP
jgi:hypothetical protein